jgi:hypothetical protein
VVLGDLVSIAADNVQAADLELDAAVLVLDTTHAYEGFVLFKHSVGGVADVGSTKRRLKPGDVIISRLRPYLRQVAWIDPVLFCLDGRGNEVLASTEFYVLRSREGFEAAAVVPYLLTPQVQQVLAASQEGGHHPRFQREVLEQLPVPPSLATGHVKIAERVREVSTRLRSAVVEAAALVTSLQVAPSAELAAEIPDERHANGSAAEVASDAGR